VLACGVWSGPLCVVLLRRSLGCLAVLACGVWSGIAAVVELSYPPDAVHTPGVALVIADRLSRIHAPGGSGTASPSLHPSLKDAVLTPVPVRDRCWYRALAPDPA
jgi:hypothetical protein